MWQVSNIAQNTRPSSAFRGRSGNTTARSILKIMLIHGIQPLMMSWLPQGWNCAFYPSHVTGFSIWKCVGKLSEVTTEIICQLLMWQICCLYSYLMEAVSWFSTMPVWLILRVCFHIKMLFIHFPSTQISFELWQLAVSFLQYKLIYCT